MRENQGKVRMAKAEFIEKMTAGGKVSAEQAEEYLKSKRFVNDLIKAGEARAEKERIPEEEAIALLGLEIARAKHKEYLRAGYTEKEAKEMAGKHIENIVQGVKNKNQLIAFDPELREETKIALNGGIRPKYERMRKK